MTITPGRLDELERIADAATPGEWSVGRRGLSAVNGRIEQWRWM